MKTSIILKVLILGAISFIVSSRAHAQVFRMDKSGPFNSGSGFSKFDEPDYKKLLELPAKPENTANSSPYTMHSRTQGMVFSSPHDNMPVLFPFGNYPIRNFKPDPTLDFPMPIKKVGQSPGFQKK